MKTRLALVGFGISAFAVQCLASPAAGPQAADEVLRQNPQIKTLPGIPAYLKGDNVQDCPAGGAVDLSRSRCVVAYVPNTNNVFVFALYPDSRKVWLVLQTDRAYMTSVFLGAFDISGHLLPQRGAAANLRSPPATKQSTAVQSGQFASGQTDKQSTIDRQWFGKWKGSAESSSLEISANMVRYRHLAGDEGVYQPVVTLCKWSSAKDALREMGTGDCRFSYSERTKSKEDIAPAFEKRAREYCSKNPTVGFLPDGKPIACGSKGDRITAAFNESRRALATMKPGMHNLILLNDSGEVHELIFDGEKILRISPDYSEIQYIEIFVRAVSGKSK